MVPPDVRPGRSPSASACDPHRETIDLGLVRGRNAGAIWQDQSTPEARVVIETAPSDEAQVDYGTGPMGRDPQTRKYRRRRLFVLTLGYSRKCVRLLAFRSSARIWAELHEKAFRRLGGPCALWCSIICARE